MLKDSFISSSHADYPKVKLSLTTKTESGVVSGWGDLGRSFTVWYVCVCAVCATVYTHVDVALALNLLSTGPKLMAVYHIRRYGLQLVRISHCHVAVTFNTAAHRPACC